MDSPARVFLHGGAASGSSAWPGQRDDPRFADCVFLTRPGYGEGDEPRPTDWAQESRVVADSLRAGAHVVGWSYGGIGAMLAAMDQPQKVRSLCLLEPAVFSLARGSAPVEQHIARVSPVMDRRDTMAPAEFYGALMRAFGNTAARVPSTADELLVAERLRLLAPPWEAPVSIDVVASVPTLVVTGGWNAEYDATAKSLSRAGAEHVELSGAGHRVQDDARFNDVLLQFWARNP